MSGLSWVDRCFDRAQEESGIRLRFLYLLPRENRHGSILQRYFIRERSSAEQHAFAEQHDYTAQSCMEFLKPIIQRIDKELSQLDLPQNPASLYDPQRYILSTGGKRFRPALTLMACGLCGEDPEKALPAALAVEMLHNFTLIHDDMMDQADSRRSFATVHKKWDTSVAILSGDSLYTEALWQLQNLDPAIDFRAMNRCFLEGIRAVCEGQALDMEFETRNDVRLGEYITMIQGKTGGLISAALQMGGIAAGCGADRLAKLHHLGMSLGIGFQMQDDWLDVVADQTKFGKQTGGDIREGKKTCILLSAMERCNKEEIIWLQNCLEKKPMPDEDVLDIIGLFERTGALEETKNEFLGYYRQALDDLDAFDPSSHKEDLTRLLETLMMRDY